MIIILDIAGHNYTCTILQHLDKLLIKYYSLNVFTLLTLNLSTSSTFDIFKHLIRCRFTLYFADFF